MQLVAVERITFNTKKHHTCTKNPANKAYQFFEERVKKTYLEFSYKKRNKLIEKLTDFIPAFAALRETRFDYQDQLAAGSYFGHQNPPSFRRKKTK